jgi:hypothetical protein
MDAFITSYGIPFQDFKDIMTSTNALLAGSSALALYLQKNGIDPGYEPNDMDIWIENTNQTVLSGGLYTQRSIRAQIVSFLLKHGYSTDKIWQPNEENWQLSPYKNKSIKCIINLSNADNKKIQLITVDSVISDTQIGLVDYIYTYFDLSNCMTWWDSYSDEFHTRYPDFTLKCKFFINQTFITDQVALETRIIKYYTRGFIICAPPPPIIHTYDTRHDLDNPDCILISQNAFDTWKYDDVNCIEFLKESDWNIILKVEASFYAFHRRTLYDFMLTKSTPIPYIDPIYDTPYNQSISYEAVKALLHADYSIYELLPEYSTSQVQGYNIHKTLYTMHCYSVTQWQSHTVDNILSPPSLELFQTSIDLHNSVDDDDVDEIANEIANENENNIIFNGFIDEYDDAPYDYIADELSLNIPRSRAYDFD